MKTISNSGTPHKGLKLSSKPSRQAPPSARSLKEQLVGFKDMTNSARVSTSIHTNNERPTRQSFTKDLTSSEHSRHHWDQAISFQRQQRQSFDKSMQFQRQSLLDSSQDIKRVPNQYVEHKMSKDMRMPPSLIQVTTPPVLHNRAGSALRRSITDSYNADTKNYQSETSNESRENRDTILVNPEIESIKAENSRLKTENAALKNSLSEAQMKAVTLIVVENQIKQLSNKLASANAKHFETQRQLEEVKFSYQQKCIELQQAGKLSLSFESKENKLNKEIESVKKNSAYLSKLVTDSRERLGNAEKQIASLKDLLQAEKDKGVLVMEEKRMLQIELESIQKIKKLVREMELSENDKKEVIQSHIAYEIRIIQMNVCIAKAQETHQNDLKREQVLQKQMMKEFNDYATEIGSKIKHVMAEKGKLEVELAEAKAETEKIRKQMFSGYQEIILKLKNQMSELKEQNLVLMENSDSKISIALLENDMKLAKNQNVDLLNKVRELEQYITKVSEQRKEQKQTYEKNLRNSSVSKNNLSQFLSDTSVRHREPYNKNGSSELQNIVRTYEERGVQLHARISEKEECEKKLKQKLQQIESENHELKEKLNFTTRKERSVSQSTKNQLESVRLQLKNDTESLQKRLQTVQNGLKRKNKEIREKDEFITKFLIQRVKGEEAVQEIVTTINKYFTNTD